MPAAGASSGAGLNSQQTKNWVSFDDPDPSSSMGVGGGAAAGGYFTQILVSRYSRKECNLYLAYAALLSTLLLQLKIIELILICRLVQGFYLGSTSVLRPLYIK